MGQIRSVLYLLECQMCCESFRLLGLMVLLGTNGSSGCLMQFFLWL
jgi:hypothetical protein